MKLQIDALQLLYNRLNTAEEGKTINFKAYLEDLLEQIFRTFSRDDIRVDRKVDIDTLDSKLAGQIGLIINEVATNAVKHAYAGIEHPVFEVHISEDHASGEVVLRLANNGHPVPENISFDNPETLGMRLIKALVLQLDGRVELEREPHPVFTFHVPLD